MPTPHMLILNHGIDEARRRADSKHQRNLIEAAFQILSEENEKLGFTYSGFALTCLPHKPPSETVWKKDGHNLTLLIQSGVERDGSHVGVPYGSYARFILLFLQSEAIRKKTREIELGKSMRDWMSNMGLSIGGKTYKNVNAQAKKISSCSLTFYSGFNNKELMKKGGFVDGAIAMVDESQDQSTLWQDTVILNKEFYESLSHHPVPLSETALRAIGARSLAIDVYIWLAYRLHCIKGDVEVSWPSLHAQFGSGYSRLRDFRAGFIESLELATAVYPDAKVAVGETGVTLSPSKPPVARLEG
ncbi:pirin [Komagataeibacter xylinus]|uniref:Pirin n=1 Tax=Komagataeibacter xylinus TaxID=28448 RepID=A0A318PGC0_KOMXY|nr:replication protein RepA [Komagataeibacter xylinus]PYD56189.1 pirin [Komagataeibacter xylinus]GBQ76094.1 plasmid replication initiator RepA [Komagataeibacter xylinus NBRC 15237]